MKKNKMKKKFKNKLCITGPISLRKAFAEELILLGYKNILFFLDNYDDYDYIITLYSTISDVGGFGNYHNKSSYTQLILPQDWNEALRLAAEVEDPEYVECIEDSKPYYGRPGNIYKVVNWKYSKMDCILEGSNTGSTARRRFKPSTKKEYEQQLEAKRDEKLRKQVEIGVYICFLKSSDSFSVGDSELVDFPLVQKTGALTFKVGCTEFYEGMLRDLKGFLIQHGGKYKAKDDILWNASDIEKVLSVIKE